MIIMLIFSWILCKSWVFVLLYKNEYFVLIRWYCNIKMYDFFIKYSEK